MQNIDIKLKKKIMRRIYFMFFLQKVFNSFAVKVYALISFVGFMIVQVSLVNVIANMPNMANINALYRFFVSAFLNTEFIVQALTLGALTATLLLLKDIAKTYLGVNPISA